MKMLELFINTIVALIIALMIFMIAFWYFYGYEKDVSNNKNMFVEFIIMTTID